MLGKRANGDSIRLTVCMRLPRSASTALSRAIACGTNVAAHVHRPFAQTPADFAKGCEAIYKVVKNVEQHRMLAETSFRSESSPTEGTHLRQGQDEKSNSGPVHITIAEAAHRVGRDDWRQIVDLMDSALFVIKDPHVQFQSLIERIANDLMHGYGSSVLSFDEAMQHAEIVDKKLLDGGTMGEIDSPGNYGRASWGYLVDQIRNTPADKSFAIVDGTLLSVRPKDGFQTICDKTGIGYSADMIDGWHNHSHKLHHPNEPQTDNARSSYVSGTHKSAGWQIPRRKPLPLRCFPDGISAYIQNTALPHYQRLFCLPEFVGPKDFEGIDQVLNTPVEDSGSVMDLNPIMCAAMLNAGLSHRHCDKLLKLRDGLWADHPQFRKEFEIMERSVSLN